MTEPLTHKNLCKNNAKSHKRCGGKRASIGDSSLPEETPLLTIVTSTLNAQDLLQNTISSIRELACDDIEWVVIDGESSDQTVAILANNSDIIDYWISEPDSGIYDAWNKAMQYSRGKYIMFIGAGDFIDHKTMNITLSQIKTGRYDNTIYLGTVKKFNNGQIVYTSEPDMNPSSFKYGVGYLHPGSIIPRFFYEEVTPFDTKYDIAADAKALLQIELYSHPRREALPLIVYMDASGVSSHNWLRAAKQYLNILREINYISSRQRSLLNFILFFRWLFFKKLLAGIVLSKLRTNTRNLLTGFLNGLLFFVPTFYLRQKLLTLYRARIAPSSSIHRGLHCLSPWRLSVGNNSTINCRSLLDARGGLSIGSNTMIGHQVSIYTQGHDINSPFFETSSAPVKIGDNVVIFPHVIIQPGVTISDGSVVLPGSIVTSDVKSFTIVGGAPSNFKGYRNRNIHYKLDYKKWLSL